MQIEFDPTKNASNERKHGVSLGLAAELEWDTLRSRTDTRRDYGEARQIGYAIAGQRLYCVVFVDRAGGLRRIISLRKANSREVASYVRKA